MATIDSHLIRQELKAICATSNALNAQVKLMLEQLETDPSSFDELDTVDGEISRDFPKVTLRKIYLTSNPQNFRVIAAHWEELDHVDLILAFPRGKGYHIDWAWLAKILSDRDPS